MKIHPQAILLLCTLTGSIAPVGLQGSVEGGGAQDFAELSLEELMNETVTSVSKREQRLRDVAAAVTVFSNDDLGRSGATSIADALRLVPGMNVGTVNSQQWAISSRGFNNVFANKLLVLVDGRAVYSPLFGGVFWSLEQTMLEDVDRIEVIRGPGATVWGANAVNGVINVVTRSAMDTQGGLLYGSAGDVRETSGGVRYGGKFAENTYYRVFASAFSNDDNPLANGDSADDGWQGKQGGFRIDYYPDADTDLTWQAGATGMRSDNEVAEGGNLHTLGRLTKRWSDRSGFEVQAYVDRTFSKDETRSDFRADTVDFSAQHTFGLGEHHDIIWGGGYRVAQMDIDQTTTAALVRDGELKHRILSAFIQDEISVVPDKFTLTAGVKVEHNDYTGIEIQPGIRGVFNPTPGQTIWAAVSRAVRTPSALEGENVFAMVAGAPFPGPGGGTYVPRLVGNRDLESEVLWAYELGYRIQPNRRVAVDVAVFYNDYDNLVGVTGISAFNGPEGTAELPFVNTSGGRSYGGEVSVTVSPTDSWWLSASYSLLMVDLPGSASGNPYERSSPRNQVVLRSTYEFNTRLSVDAQLRYVDTIQWVPSYLTADLRLSYQVTDWLEMSLVGQNLLDDRHPEQAPFVLSSTSEVPRSFHAKLTWRF